MQTSARKVCKCNTCGLTDAVTPFYAKRHTECAACHKRAAAKRRRVQPDTVYTCNTCRKTSDETKFYPTLNYRCAACQQAAVRRARDSGKGYRPRVFTENDPPRTCRKCTLKSNVTPFYASQPNICAACQKAAVNQNRKEKAEYYRAANRERYQAKAIARASLTEPKS